MPLSEDSGLAGHTQVVRYLLGLLPEAEADRLDEASVADDEFAARLRVEEADLVDGYVRGTLDPDTLARFESYYMASPLRRRNVEFAIRFLRAVDRAAPPGTGTTADPAVVVERTEQDPPARPCAKPDDGLARRSSVAWPFMVAAALLLVALGTLTLQPTRPRGTVNASGPANGAMLLPSEAEQQQARDAGIAALPQGVPATVLVLLPQTRAAGPVPVLAIPPRAGAVQLELRLESNEFQRYQVGLVDPASNRVVWRSEPLAATSGVEGAAVSLVVPADVLKPQHYALTVTGRNAESAVVVGSYTFQVARRP